MMLFSDFIDDNLDTLKSVMEWNNYGLSEYEIIVQDSIKEKSLYLLQKRYGKFEVEDILDEMLGEIMIHFPILIQQLSIEQILQGVNVPKVDILTETTERSENRFREVINNNTQTVDRTDKDTTIGSTTGELSEESENNSEYNNTTTITNESGTEASGSRNVGFAHAMPEQAIDGTYDFPVDEQGTPILTSAFIQNASENFNSTNPVITNESSSQIDTQDGVNTLTRTQNSTTGESIERNILTGEETVQDTTGTETETDTFSETVTHEQTNAQFSYEVTNFLNTLTTTKAFLKWCEAFGWVVGVI